MTTNKDLVAQAKAILDQIVDVPITPPPPPTTVHPVAPVGPFQNIAGGADGVYVGGTPVAQTIEKKHVSGQTDIGIGFMDWSQLRDTVGRWQLRDCIAENIGRGRTSNGTGEAGYWVGCAADGARLVARDCDWMGVWTGARCDNTVLADLDVDVTMNPKSVGVYMEHVTSNLKLLDSHIRAADNAVNIEWWYTDSRYAKFAPAGAAAKYPGRAGSHDIEIAGCVLEGQYGVFADAGTYNLNIHHCTFVGCPKGAVSYPDAAHRADPAGTVTIDWASCDTTALVGPREVVHSRAIG